MLNGSFPSERSVEDILAGRIRLTLAGQAHVLPVLTSGENEDWQATLEPDLQALIETKDAAAAMAILERLDARLLDLIYAYDKAGVLPARESIARDVYPHELLKAFFEVRLASNPTLGYGIAMLTAEAREAQAAATAALATTAETVARPNRAARRSRPSSSSRKSSTGRGARSATS